MTIAGVGQWCKAVIKRIPTDVLVVATLVLASMASFGFGYLAGKSSGKGSAVSLEITPPTVSSPGLPAATYVASKNGTKFYLSTCASAKRISAANKISFASAAAALAAGYAPAANCPGL